MIDLWWIRASIWRSSGVHLDLKFSCFGGLIFDDFFEPLQIPLLIDVGSVLAPILALFSTCFGEQLRSSKLSSRCSGNSILKGLRARILINFGVLFQTLFQDLLGCLLGSIFGDFGIHFGVHLGP